MNLIENKLKQKINGRVVFIMAHGKSIEQLENYIYDLKNYDICWSSLGAFIMMEEFILSKINKHLEIVFDMATVSGGFHDYYETQVRLPRITNFLEQNSNNLWITSYGMVRDSLKEFKPNWIAKEWQKEGLSEDKGIYSDQIQLADQLVTLDEVPQFMNVPNSVCLMIGCMIAGGANKIITFGLDGNLSISGCPLDSCYHPELIEEERKVAIGSLVDPGITRDTRGFQTRFPSLLKWYQERFNNYPSIYNCSPNSLFDVIPKISYTDLVDIFKKG